MRYKVLVADDEPIILSGIRHLMDWSAVDAEIIGCTSNGADAYSIIEREHPDIVITDIRMPVMDGLALAGRCSEEFPDIVFIILTSLAEFSLAKEAIGYGISDYLLKTELDGERLRQALIKAEEECRRRREGYGKDRSEKEEDRVPSVISSLLLMRDVTHETKALLDERGLLSGYAFIAFAFSFPSPSLETQWTSDDYMKLHDWEKDVVEKVLSSSLSSFWPVVPVAGKSGTLVYFTSGLSSDTWNAVSSRLEDKAASASAMVTGLRPSLLRTSVMDGRDSLRIARSAIERELMAYYLEKDADQLSPSSLDIDAVFPRLEQAIVDMDGVSCRACFSVIRTAVSSSDHSLSQFMFMVSVLRSALSSGLAAIGLQGDGSVMDVFETVDFITRRSEAETFLDDAESGLVTLLGSKGRGGGGVADKAREYILAHITERISLGDVAEYACVSPGYMSKSFKRIMGMSLVDYINTMKIERAKELMGEGQESRIADIALSLGFHNIYYFSKVFRKVEGIPPTEYMKKLHTMS